NIFFPKEEDRKLVILPNPYAPHDTFNGLPAEAVTATGWNIVPGGLQGKAALFLSIPFRGGQSRYKNVPLQIGLRVVGQHLPPHTCNGRPAEAVTATGLKIVPEVLQGKAALFLSIPFRGGQSRYKNVPLQTGLRVVRQPLPPNKPFLPVLMKGDLRELDASTPCLHLHALHLDRLTEHSELERRGIQ